MELTNPCLNCTRVADPDNCENKLCPQWRSWFFAKWNETRALFGNKKAINEPCRSCDWKGPLCATGCPVKDAYKRR